MAGFSGRVKQPIFSAWRFFRSLISTGNLADTPRREFAIGIHSAGQSGGRNGIANRWLPKTVTHDNKSESHSPSFRLHADHDDFFPGHAIEVDFYRAQACGKGMKATKELARSIGAFFTGAGQAVVFLARIAVRMNNTLPIEVPDRLPTRIDPCPIVEAIAEIRFVSAVPSKLSWD